MNNYPKTLEEARATRFGSWAGDPTGRAYQEGKCAFTGWAGGRGSLPGQCSHKNGHGPAGLYCKRHAPQVEPLPGISVYKTCAYDFDIKETAVAKIDDKYIWHTNGRKQARCSKWGQFWEFKNSAIQHLIARADSRIQSAQQIIAREKAAKETLQKLLENK